MIKKNVIEKKKFSKLAILSFVLSIILVIFNLIPRSIYNALYNFNPIFGDGLKISFILIFFSSIPGFILGWISLVYITKKSLRGKWMAVTSIILGFLSLLFILFIILLGFASFTF